jgi:hypothetical protein
LVRLNHDCTPESQGAFGPRVGCGASPMNGWFTEGFDPRDRKGNSLLKKLTS